jgi:hypothetical protein
MPRSLLNWQALAATTAACALADGGLLVLAWWLTGDVLAAIGGLAFVGGPFTLFIAAPMYAWFKDAFQRGAAA